MLSSRRVTYLTFLILLFAAFGLHAQSAPVEGPCDNGVMQCADGSWVLCVWGCPVLNCPGDCGCPGRGCLVPKNYTPIPPAQLAKLRVQPTAEELARFHRLFREFQALALVRRDVRPVALE